MALKEPYRNVTLIHWWSFLNGLNPIEDLFSFIHQALPRKLWIRLEIKNDGLIILNEFTERNVSNVSRKGFQRDRFHSYQIIV